MRRADRLFEIVTYLRGRRLTTAAQLAGWLEVSERTIYRDIADLTASGLPIDGEAGVGYRLSPAFDLPPLMFTHDEIDALVTGARFAESWGGPGLAKGARSALAKIAAALPQDRRASLESSRLFVPGFFVDPQHGEHIECLRRAIDGHRYVDMDYRNGEQQLSRRRIRPFGLFFWRGTWLLGSWCELRNAFRTFRVDRIERIADAEERFPEEPGRTLADYLRKMKEE